MTTRVVRNRVPPTQSGWGGSYVLGDVVAAGDVTMIRYLMDGAYSDVTTDIVRAWTFIAYDAEFRELWRIMGPGRALGEIPPYHPVELDPSMTPRHCEVGTVFVWVSNNADVADPGGVVEAVVTSPQPLDPAHRPRPDTVDIGDGIRRIRTGDGTLDPPVQSPVSVPTTPEPAPG